MVSFDKNDRFIYQRAQMLRTQLMARDITDPAVLDVMGKVPREEFLPEKYSAEAYGDFPIPIGIGQTISQPYIVALMTQALRLNDQCTVLELGTGSGYQAAILSKLSRKVYTIERHHELSESAQAVIGRLGIDNVEFYIGDGSKGWPDEGIEFDRIIVTAAMPDVPECLTDQLKNNGILVAPVGGEYSQNLLVLEKDGEKFHKKYICPCRFVKLIGEHGFPG